MRKGRWFGALWLLWFGIVVLCAGAEQVPPERRGDVEYRIVVALGKSHQWDRALEQGLAFVKTHRKTIWEPRGLYWLGRLYLAVPHQGFRVGSRFTRGNNAPQTDSDARPEIVNVAEQDGQNARDALEAARVLFPTYRAAHHTEEEEIQLDYDLIHVLQAGPDFLRWAEQQKWLPPNDPNWKVNPADGYVPEWDPPKKIRTLFAQIEALAPRTPHKSHTLALALFARALWLDAYQRDMDSYAVREENGKPIRIPYPYQDEHPVDLLRQAVRAYPDDLIRDQAEFLRAGLLERDGKFLAAEATFRQFLLQRPRSKWASDAHAHLQVITRQQVTLAAPLGAQKPGVNARLDVGYRNVRRLHFAVYRVRLEDILNRPQWQRDPQRDLSSFESVFGTLQQAAKAFGPVVAQWDRTTKDTGDHAYHAETVAAPVRAVGAYVVVVSAPGAKAANLLLVTDLALVQKVHRDGALYYAADAQTGRPVAGARLLAKQWWEPDSGKTQCAATRGATTPEGQCNVPFARGPKRSNFQIAALAVLGDRYALVGAAQTYDSGDNPGTVRVYSTTDRSVYRPAQTVHYRQLVMRRQHGDFLPLTNRRVKVVVSDPGGKVVYQTMALSSEFGSVNGQFELEAGCPLGEYAVNVTVPGLEEDDTEAGGNRFRVEEYKKPEFEVTVTPEAERVRLGQPTAAKIAAKYYFGGPVPRAHVTYRVYRNGYTQTYRFPQPYDFLTNYADNGDYDTDYRRGEVIAQGVKVTDDNGEARITFPTQAEKQRWRDQDLSYTVEADVQDSSRRTISGTGVVKATRHDVAVFLNYPHGYATQGDRVDLEIQTLNPSDQPVAAEGTVRVYRQPETTGAKETLEHQESLATDAQGFAIFHWMTDRAGYYRIAFVTHDSAAEEVEGSLFVWIDGPELARGRFLFRDVFLAVRNPYYAEGETAKVLLITPAPDCTVLLTREADNEILERRLVRVPGRSLELSIPLSHADAPNVFLSAILIRNGQMFQATEELFVPPARQFTTIAVEADKERYEPGEQATIHLHALDWQGQPLRTELCVSVADAALNYIQKDYAPDIRAYFYGNRRSQSTEANGSLDTNLEPVSEDLLPLQKYALHDFALPDGLGQIPDWPGKDRGIETDPALSKLATAYIDSPVPSPRRADPFGPTWQQPSGHILQGDEGGRMWAYPPRMQPSAGEPARPEKQRKSLLDEGTAYNTYPGMVGELAQPTLRSKFLDTAFWTPAVVTDAQGNATVTVTWPDNLTQWRAKAVGNTATAQVGSGETRVTTKKDLLVRLQAPRFCVEGDQVVLSANVQNYLPDDAQVKVRLDLDGDAAEIVACAPPAPQFWGESYCAGLPFSPQTWGAGGACFVEVPQNGETRVDWVVKVKQAGALHIRMTAQSETAADAMESEVPVLIYGAERATTQSGVLRDQAKAELQIVLPEARKPHSAELIVQLDPSLGAVMLDALPYLAGYPYGCVEQTMSRFLPSLVVAKTLKDLGYNLSDLRKRALEMHQRRQQGGSVPIADSPYTYPQGRPGTLQTPELAAGLDRADNPVFDNRALAKMVADGLTRLAAMQHADGGWGWWPDDASDAYMSAYVLYGLLTARQAGTPVNTKMLDRGLIYLRARLLADSDLNRMAYEARVLAMDAASRAAIHATARDRLYPHRERLSAYGKALLALALHDLGDTPQAGILLDNLETTAKVDAANGTASWDAGDSFWWRWYNDRVETSATILQAYLAIRPGAKLASMLMQWLVHNRLANAWNTTRETALAVYALADYARVNRELAADYTLTVDLGGRIQRQYTVTHANALFFDNQFIVPDALLQTGAQTLTLTRQGQGTCYYAAYTRYFSQEESIAATGNEITVRRRYFRLLPGTASGTPEPIPLDAKRPNPFLTGRYELLNVGGEWTEAEDTSGGPRYQRVALQPGEALKSGDLLEVVLQLEAKNDYDYVIFEDIKPAGCEPVELRSGYHAAGSLCSKMELRDQKVAFFLSGMPQGTHLLSYRLRAEAPGQFQVLPTNGYAMYAPDVRALSDSTRLDIRDEETTP